jgi:hypothetical protein
VIAVDSMAVLKLALELIAILPSIGPVAVLHVFVVLTLVCIARHWLPIAISVHVASFELAFIESAILPDVPSSTVESSIQVLSIVTVSVRKELETLALLLASKELSIIFAYLCTQLASSIEKVILKVAFIFFSVCLEHHTIAVFHVSWKSAFKEVNTGKDL